MYDSIYLLQTRESLFKHDSVFKIGRTSQDELKRFNCYPKGSKLHLHISCFDGVSVERTIINLFNNKYSNDHMYGSEYFHGNLCDMIHDILNVIGLNFDSIHNHTKMCNILSEKDNTNKLLKKSLDDMQQQNNHLKEQMNDLQQKITDLQNIENIGNIHNQTSDNIHNQTQISNIDLRCIDPKISIYSDELVARIENTKFKEAFTKTHDNKWLCLKCKKTMSVCSKRYHYETSCKKGLHTLQCPYCYVYLDSYMKKFKHKKICTRKELQHKVTDFKTSQCLINEQFSTNIHAVRTE